ncbi:MAG: hypothetical protein KBE09_01985 [Candidatus Pacebacteria bacterium]|nr:hypothetical protein [Candidatus Paceibacterota bacterium]
MKKASRLSAVLVSAAVLFSTIGPGEGLAAGSAKTPAIAQSAPATGLLVQQAPMSTPRTYAQAFGSVCRNGLFYCITGGFGPIGGSCCGCGFCGWWSFN